MRTSILLISMALFGSVGVFAADSTCPEKPYCGCASPYIPTCEGSYCTCKDPKTAKLDPKKIIKLRQ